MSTAIDLNFIVNGPDFQTNFHTMLLKLIFKADRHNRARLKKVFPNAVLTVERYKRTGEILDLEED